MKNYLLPISILLSINVNAEDIAKFQREQAIGDYISRVTKEDTLRRKPLIREKVNVQEKDVNGDGNLDLLIFDGYHCSMSGCRSDIYLSLNVNSESRVAPLYCYSGRLQEGDLKKKAAQLKCK